MWRLILLLGVAILGLWFGKTKELQEPISTLEELPVREHKSFVIVLYAHNKAEWCKRALYSIFEQNYDHYRVIVIDDGSIDGTEEIAKNFILENHQDEKVILIRNETSFGPVASLYRVIDHCLDREIILPIDAKDWLTTPYVLTRLNALYQNPDVWMVASSSIEYPDYQILKEEGPACFYAALFKEIKLRDLLMKGRFTTNPLSYLKILKTLAKGKVVQLQEPIGFQNRAPSKKAKDKSRVVAYEPLSAFPEPRKEKSVEVLILSEDRPLELYTCLESLQRSVQGFQKITVLYHASSPTTEASYRQLENTFPAISFCPWQKAPKVSADYVLLGVNEKNISDFIDLKLCVNEIERTGAAALTLLGEHLPRGLPLSSGTFALKEEGEWARPQHFLTLYPKKVVEEALGKAKSPKLVACDLPKDSIELFKSF